MSNKGRRNELRLVRDVNAVTTDEVFCSALDYSGNAADSDADLVVTYSYGRCAFALHLFEMKTDGSTESGKRTTIMSGSSDGEDGLDELRRLASAGPDWSDSWLVVNFANRELLVMHAGWLYAQVTDEPAKYPDGESGPGKPRAEWREWREIAGHMGYEAPDPVEACLPRATPGGNVSIRKPSVHESMSARAGRADAVALLEAFLQYDAGTTPDEVDHLWSDENS